MRIGRPECEAYLSSGLHAQTLAHDAKHILDAQPREYLRVRTGRLDNLNAGETYALYPNTLCVGFLLPMLLGIGFAFAAREDQGLRTIGQLAALDFLLAASPVVSPLTVRPKLPKSADLFFASSGRPPACWRRAGPSSTGSRGPRSW